MPQKLTLAHVPTPLIHNEALDRLAGTEVWVKRDDMTAGPEAGNKVRKLEYLFADAIQRGKRTVITCGGAQSNHARATALVAASLGLRAVLYLRTPDPARPPEPAGNLLLDRLAGAEVRFITPADYAKRNELMDGARSELERRGEPAYVIPEGGSNGLGSLGYVDALGEIREQLDRGFAGGPIDFDVVVHACGSGGTLAGVALGIARHGVAGEVRAIAVCDDRAYFERVAGRIVQEARAIDPTLPTPGPIVVHDEFKGPAYGVATPEQLALIVQVACTSGLILDPVYTGKAFYGLTRLDPKPRRALFLHTGGLPGLLADPGVFSGQLAG